MSKKQITRKKYGKAELEQIKNMIAEGHTDKYIARWSGRTRAAVVTLRWRLSDGKEPKTVDDTNRQLPLTRQRRKPQERAAINKDNRALIDLIVGADVSKTQKLRCLEALL